MTTEVPEPDETRRENEQEFVDEGVSPDVMPNVGGPPGSSRRESSEGPWTNQPPAGDGGDIQSPTPVAGGGDEAELASHVPPDVDPTVGEMANEEVAQARRDIEAGLTSGDMTLEDLFIQSDNERDEATQHRVMGHMHIRAALMALPHIGELRTDDILREVGIEGNTHIDALGDNQRQEIIDLVEVWDV